MEPKKEKLPDEKLRPPFKKDQVIIMHKDDVIRKYAGTYNQNDSIAKGYFV